MSTIATQDRKALCKMLAEQRVQFLTLMVFCDWVQNKEVMALITKKAEVLYPLYTDGFATFSDDELTLYSRWQKSPIVVKIEKAARDGKIENPQSVEALLSKDEREELNKFHKSEIARKRAELDVACNKKVEALFVEISEEIESLGH